jgi:basic membrane protein A
MKKLALAFAASAAAILSVGSAAQAADKTKVCFVYVGSHTDGGYSQAHDLGRQQIQKEFGDKIDTPYLENVPEGPDAERAIERLARSGCKLIFTTSFGFMDATVKVAAKFPM